MISQESFIDIYYKYFNCQYMIKTEKNLIIITAGKASFKEKNGIEEAISSIENSGYPEILLDLSNTEYLESQLLGLLMWEKERLKEKNINLSIIKLSKQLYETFSNLKLIDFFEIK